MNDPLLCIVLGIVLALPPSSNAIELLPDDLPVARLGAGAAQVAGTNGIFRLVRHEHAERERSVSGSLPDSPNELIAQRLTILIRE
jgi:hypothetical protein